MLEGVQCKLLNCMVFWKLMQYESHYPFKRDQVQRIQRREIRRLVRRAYSLPFYRQRFDAAGVKPEDIVTAEDFLKLPVLTKDEYRDWVESSYAQNPAAYKHAYQESTSGSTGKPLVIYLRPRDKAAVIANWLRMATAQGFRPFTDVTLNVELPHRQTKKRDSILQKMGLLRRYVTNSYANPGELVEQVNRIRPDFMYAYKSIWVAMANYALQNGIQMHQPKYYASASEMMDIHSRRLITSQFGEAHLYDTYGTTETGALAFECMGKPGKYTITHDTHVVNFLPAEGAAAGRRPLLTALHLHSFPVINYDIGDYMETVEEDGLTYITKIYGRMDDVAVMENGDEIGYQYFYEAMVSHNEIAQSRIIQEDHTHITLLLAPRVDIPFERAKTEEELRAYLYQCAGHPEVVYTVEWVDSIPQDPNGKVRMLISKVKK